MRTKILAIILLLLLSPSLGFATNESDDSDTSEKTPQKHVLDIKNWSTTQGTKVYFVNIPELPIVDIKVAFAAGSARDDQSYGIATLTNNLLDQSAGDLTGDQIANQFAGIGAEYDHAVGRDIAVVSLRSLINPTYLKTALDTFSLVLSKPTFSDKDVKRLKDNQISSIQQMQESPSDIANKIFYETLYLNMPYAHPTLGTQNTVAGIKTSEVNNFYKKYYVAKNAVIVIVGAIQEDQAKKIAEQLMQTVALGNTAPAIPKPLPLKKSMTQNVPFPSTQTNIRMGQLGISHNNPDYYALMVGNYTLGGASLISRLFEEVRENRGLTYNISSSFIPLASPGPFIISLATKNSQSKEAQKITLDTVRKFLSDGPSSKELEAAKQGLTGGFPLKLDSNQAIAETLLNMAFYNLPLDYLDTYQEKINQVTQKDITNAFNKYINLNTQIIVSVGGNR
ncbi:MAG: insulinase family protein [Proteobacteria bacterium]|nr:insulinase family protein [Pseudomonadota bacterium]